MVRRIVLSVSVFFLFVSSVFAADAGSSVSNEEIVHALSVVTDCLSSALAVRYSSDTISLPCTSVSVDSESGLPRRVSFFLADPSDYMKVLNIGNPDTTGLVSNFFYVFSKTSRNPLLYLAYNVISSRGYNTGDCLINGTITFDFPADATISDLIEAVLSRKCTEGRRVLHTVDLSLYGDSFENPVSVAGQFETYVNESGLFVVSSVGNFQINGYSFSDGRFEF